MTYRERREAKAERLRDWAEKREAKSTAAYERATGIADGIPFGQPILVGHHSQRRAERDRDRIGAAMDASVEHSRMAASMTARANGIESQLERSIYSDDDDAIEKLRERIAGLEAERDRIKAYNASCRKGARDTSLLDKAQQAELVSIVRHTPYNVGPKGQMPAYVLSNLGGNITRNRKRLASLEAQRAREAADAD